MKRKVAMAEQSGTSKRPAKSIAAHSIALNFETTANNLDTKPKAIEKDIDIISLEKDKDYRKRVVADLYREVVQRRNRRKAEALRKSLLESRHAVLKRAKELQQTTGEPRTFKRRLASNDCPPTRLEGQIYCRECVATPNSSALSIPQTETTNATTVQPSRRRDDDNTNNNKPISVRMRTTKVNKTTLVSFSKAISLEGTHDPLPKSNATIFLKTHYATEDEQNLTYVPYFGDDDREDVVSELYNLEGREKLIEFGPEYQERDTNDAIDEMLVLLRSRLGAKENLSRIARNEINEDLADEMDVSAERIQVRHTKMCRDGGENTGSRRSKSSSGSDKQQQLTNSSSSEQDLASPKKNSSTLTQLSYKDVMDSYRSIFCRRCFTYDCNMHGNLSKPNLELQGELAVQKEREGHWEDLEGQTVNDGAGKKLPTIGGASVDKKPKRAASDKAKAKLVRKRTLSKVSTSKEDNSQTELTPLQKSVCERAFLVFQADLDKISAAIDAPRNLVAEYVEKEKLTLPEFRHVKPEGNGDNRKKNKTSMKNYNFAWLRRLEDAEIHPLFVPCDHEGPCSLENCSCVKNAFFCTKHCVWGAKSRNFFRGCACKGGKCGTKSCACFAAKRECDPDLCRTCGACTDPSNQPATKQRCRNDNIGMRRHSHLLLGTSTIKDAGWGIYSKHALKKGDFVHEYVGEVISQEEAERRGRIYDKVNRSYLFNLSSDYVVDASRKGNKTRFANHSSKPNCYTKMVNVNGDIRIGLFAKEDIEPQSELFFDYRYDVGLDNDLIIKPGKTVEWMRDPKMANKISKKNASSDLPPGEVRVDG